LNFNEYVIFRVTSDQKRELYAGAKESGVTVSEYLREKIFMYDWVSDRICNSQQRRPKAEDCPEWAKSIAKDKDGNWYAFSYVPKKDKDGWILPEGPPSEWVDRVELIMRTNNSSNWYNTLKLLK
jgi:hypothetical protein